MRKLLLAAVLVLMASGVEASSYLDIFGTVHDPILTRNGAVHGYSGTNLAPFANLDNATLAEANLYHANLSGAELSDANLSGAYLANAYLANANLSGANLTGVILFEANLPGADLTGANLSGATYLCCVYGIPNYDALTDFTNARVHFDATSPLFDPVAAGWNLVPEPNTALLVGIGLAGMAARRRV